MGQTRSSTHRSRCSSGACGTCTARVTLSSPWPSWSATLSREGAEPQPRGSDLSPNPLLHPCIHLLFTTRPARHAREPGAGAVAIHTSSRSRFGSKSSPPHSPNDCGGKTCDGWIASDPEKSRKYGHLRGAQARLELRLPRMQELPQRYSYFLIDELRTTLCISLPVGGDGLWGRTLAPQESDEASMNILPLFFLAGSQLG